jgi:hypothetical protein
VDNKQKAGKIGGARRAEILPPERKSEIARAGAMARWNKDLPEATYEGEFTLGGTPIACAVLPNGTRIITQAAFLRALGRSRSPKAGTGVLSTVDELPFFLQADALKPFISDDLAMSTNPIFYKAKSGGRGVGYDARLLPQVAEVYLQFRDAKLRAREKIPARYEGMIVAADILIRALANIGIIALVDEATGFQRARAHDALARILEEFIAKELQPYVRMFQDSFYQELFRLRGLDYPKDTVKRPQYFGHLTNDIVYARLAPGVLDELRKISPRREDGRLVYPFTRRLTENKGLQKLHDHLVSVETIMRLSKDYDTDFMEKLDLLHPRWDKTMKLPFPDDGKGL